MRLFAFDRDSTVDLRECEKPLVPLAWVRYLAHETDDIVWAHGNQKLVDEAEIPGDERALELYEEKWGDPVEHVEKRVEPNLEDWLETPGVGPDPDVITALAKYKTEGDRPSRNQRVRLIGSLFPDCDQYIAIDNRYLGYLAGWCFYFPWDFVREFAPVLDAAAGTE